MLTNENSVSIISRNSRNIYIMNTLVCIPIDELQGLYCSQSLQDLLTVITFIVAIQQDIRWYLTGSS